MVAACPSRSIKARRTSGRTASGRSTALPAISSWPPIRASTDTAAGTWRSCPSFAFELARLALVFHVEHLGRQMLHLRGVTTRLVEHLGRQMHLRGVPTRLGEAPLEL